MYDGYIQWKYTDDAAWNNLIALSDLKGEKGDKGDTGAPGQDGRDGIAPQLKIGDGGFWYVSYDKGNTWTSLGVKAAGTDGTDGKNGEKGDKGDSGNAGKDGRDGVGIADVTLNDAGELIITLTDGTVKNLGRVSGTDGKNGSDGRDGKDGVGISAVTVDKDGNITVTFTDGSTHKAGSIPVSKEEVQALKTMAGAAAGVAGVSLAGLLAGMGCVLLKRKKQV